jgi:hypothetical protein
MICKLKFSLSSQPWYTSDYYELIDKTGIWIKNNNSYDYNYSFRNLKTGEVEHFFSNHMDDVTNLNETKRYLRDLKINNLLKNG